MTNKLNLMSFLFLLLVSCFVSGSLSLHVEDPNPQNTTKETEVQPTSGHPQTVWITEGLSAAPNGTQPESNGTQPESAGTESPRRTSFPVTNGSSDPVTPSSAPTFSSSIGGNGTNATTTVPIVITTGHMVTDKRTTSGTTVVVSSTVIQTTQPAKSHGTQKTASACPTAEPKQENQLGRCLLAIAVLTAIATVFIMTTIILATRLAGSTYKHRPSLLHDTEMVCISTFMNDSDHPVPAPRRPKSNGALIPISADEDGDDLTLNSFLHDAEGVA